MDFSFGVNMASFAKPVTIMLTRYVANIFNLEIKSSSNLI